VCGCDDHGSGGPGLAADGPIEDGFDGRAYARERTPAPGVYRMYAADDSLLYVGKAASAKKRVASYFTKALPTRSPRGPGTAT